MSCEHCRITRCPVLNKDQCPFNELWDQDKEAKATMADIEQMLKKGEGV